MILLEYRNGSKVIQGGKGGKLSGPVPKRKENNKQNKCNNGVLEQKSRELPGDTYTHTHILK